MIIDKLARFDTANAVTTSESSVDIMDLGVNPRDIGKGEPLWVEWRVATAATAAGAATVTFSIQTATGDAFTTSTTLVSTAAIGKATLVAGYRTQLRIPPGVQRYIRVYYTVATGPLTAGAFDAYMLLDSQQHAYPAARSQY